MDEFLYKHNLISGSGMSGVRNRGIFGKNKYIIGRWLKSLHNLERDESEGTLPEQTSRKSNDVLSNIQLYHMYRNPTENKVLK